LAPLLLLVVHLQLQGLLLPLLLVVDLPAAC
jgi:hypothetical protein